MKDELNEYSKAAALSVVKEEITPSVPQIVELISVVHDYILSEGCHQNPRDYWFMLLGMSTSGGQQEPHPHNVHWTGLIAFGGIVTVLGAAVTGFAKPSVGYFDYWTYPTTFMAYLGLALAFVGLCGLVRGWDFPFAAGESASKPRAKKPSQNSAKLSTLDPLTPIETPIKPPSLSDHFKDPYTKGEPDLSAIPPNLAKLQKKNSFPDFTEEWKERDRLMQRCAGDVEESDAIWAWINSVHDKLATVSRSKAMEFKPDQSAVTQGPKMMRQVDDMVRYLNRGIKENQSRKNLIEYGQRLAKIEDEVKNG